ncbi:hypothetical protein [Myxococcus sp. Y35]|uniref:hypothetical protein n=1 Tax=Pseudomyxococcus flavus TaxID=3115648 RepID=UPI003CF4F434
MTLPLHPRRIRAATHRGLLVLLLVAGCTPEIELTRGAVFTDPKRTTLAYVQDDHLVRRQGTVEKRIPRERFGCVPPGFFGSNSTFRLFSGGKRAFLIATGFPDERRIDELRRLFTFSRAGEALATSCILDLENEKGIPLESLVPAGTDMLEVAGVRRHVYVGRVTDRIYTWSDEWESELEVLHVDAKLRILTPLPVSRQRCQLAESDEELLIACWHEHSGFRKHQLVVTRYPLGTWPPKARDTTTLNVPPNRDADFEFLPDGRHLVVWGAGTGDLPPSGKFLVVLDLRTSKPAVVLQDMSWQYTPKVEPTADGKGFLLVESQPPEGLRRHTGRVRHYGFDGQQLGTWTMRKTPEKLIAPADGQGFWAEFYQNARWQPLR